MNAPLHRESPPRMTFTAVLLTLSICLLWGGNPVAVQFAAKNLPPLLIASIRFLLATGFMYFWCRLGGHRISITRQQLPYVVGGGILLFVQIGLFHLGIARTSSSHATLLINTYVFWVMVLESYLLRAALLSRWKISGLILAAIGVVIIILSSLGQKEQLDQPTLRGDVLLAFSGLMLALKILLTKAAMPKIASSPFIFWHDLIGMSLLVIASLTFETWPGMEAFDMVSCVSLAYQGLCVAGFCFGMQAYLLQKYSATSISVFSFTSPIFGVMLGVAIRGDEFSVWFGLAALLVAGGIYLVNRPD
ncbi:putative amino-acid metabolite efflux pump [Polystyrenella longa]|uniref:Putative amino-acid metabolite efflux pump n=1 Tax=Polystyrenella longa TaxID=2528007 RepID=A0A518CI76_9PLAN|nr:DMT family transporter [Polystyrenella longa]QDU78932.1 putative amino-acid metabolite efflux pump [Polystyrenella longa]